MRDLKIAYGNGRTAKQWSNKTIRFADLKERLKTTIRTSESAEEYAKFTKAQRDAVKDHGGFVAGVLKGGRRKIDTVESRSMVALDGDKIDAEFLKDYEKNAPYTSVLYTTHSHTDENPRVRLVFPLTRDVTSEEWDRVTRVEKLLIDYFGAEDNSYTKAAMRKTLIAAVARTYHPGVKFDSALILVGAQGIGKSTFFSKLAGSWFSDSLTLTDMKDKAGAEKLQGFLILELGEMAGMKKVDIETIKSFLSRTDDIYRPSYGRVVESHPRQCIVVGSTNAENGFLRDITGNRRFWPVNVCGDSAKKSWQLTANEVSQIWAEALYLYSGDD